jgi:hypothetical protein
MATGVGNFGYILGRPAAANDVVAAYFTGSAYAGTTFSTTTGGGVFSINGNSPYTASDYTSELVQSRVVSFGMRIRYTGRSFDQGGIIRVLEEPDHNNLAGDGFNTIAAYSKVRSLPVSTDWVTVTWQPVLPGEFEFVNEATFGRSLFFPLVIGVSSAVPAAPFEFEYYLNYESIGSIVRGKSISHSEQNLTGKIINAISRFGPRVFEKVSQNPGATSQVAMQLLRAVKPGLDWAASAAFSIGATTAPLLLT